MSWNETPNLGALWKLGLLALLACRPAVEGLSPGVAVRWTPDPLASAWYESTPTFSPDGQEMYFFRADRSFRHYQLLWTKCERREWAAPTAPSFAATPPALEADPAFSQDGRWLYFVSSRSSSAEAAEGNLDIWRVERHTSTGWALPERLPEPVNSAASELLPRPLSDGRLLFGSSRGGGFGQSDVYLATPDASGGWSVVNLGPPVSTEANEYEAELSLDGQTLVVVRDRGSRSHLELHRRLGSGWSEAQLLVLRPEVFQVGPVLSPRADRLLFAQDDGLSSGEIFLLDLKPEVDASWPPKCGPI